MYPTTYIPNKIVDIVTTIISKPRFFRQKSATSKHIGNMQNKNLLKLSDPPTLYAKYASINTKYIKRIFLEVRTIIITAKIALTSHIINNDLFSVIGNVFENIIYSVLPKN